MFSIPFIDHILDSIFRDATHEILAKKSIALGVITSIFLVIIKFLAWIITNSISMQASMTDSILDALASFIAYHALIFASVNYDENHNFGHEKVEGVVALLQCLLVIYSGIVIWKEAYEMFVEPEPVVNSSVGIIVMAVSCFAVYQLVYFQKYVTAKTESILVKGDALHYLSDLLMNLGIMLSLIVSRFFIYIDAICGLAIGSYVLYNAAVVIRNALIDLMDEALPESVRDKIRKVILSVDGVIDIKLLRTRSAGMKKYVEATVFVDNKLSLVEADGISSEVKSALAVIGEKIDILVKVEPK